MAEAIAIEAEARDRAGKGVARAVRRAKKVPGVIYGGGEPPTLISMDAHRLFLLLQDGTFMTHVVDIAVDGRTVRALPRDIQYHPVSDVPVHIDFLRLGAGTTVHVEVPVQFLNEDRSPGLRAGGVLNIVRHAVELVCPADAIPEHITVDLAEANLMDSLRISAAALPEGVRPAVTDRDFVLATIAAPSALRSEGQDQAAAAPAEAATPAKA